jgi:hypothetical protein
MANSGGKFNVRNPAVKRIMQVSRDPQYWTRQQSVRHAKLNTFMSCLVLQEIKELQAETCPDFIADALEVGMSCGWSCAGQKQQLSCNSSFVQVAPAAGPEMLCGVLLFHAQEDIFEWHFVIRGPPDTEFEVRARQQCYCMMVQKFLGRAPSPTGHSTRKS